MLCWSWMSWIWVLSCLMFRVMDSYCFGMLLSYSISSGVLESKPWFPSSMLYNDNIISITRNHHTNNNP